MLRGSKSSLINGSVASTVRPWISIFAGLVTVWFQWPIWEKGAILPAPGTSLLSYSLIFTPHVPKNRGAYPSPTIYKNISSAFWMVFNQLRNDYAIVVAMKFYLKCPEGVCSVIGIDVGGKALVQHQQLQGLHQYRIKALFVFFGQD